MRVGLFFGSFNPVHIGHLALANYLLSFSKLDEVWFVVSPQNPFKAGSDLIEASKRLEMVQIAIGGFEKFKVCDLELTLPLPSYTIDTLDALSMEFPKNEFVVLMGGDNIGAIMQWKSAHRILSEFELMVYPRLGFDLSNLSVAGNVTVVGEAPIIEISSSFIREAFDAGKDVRFFMPQGVYDYVEKNDIFCLKK